MTDPSFSGAARYHPIRRLAAGGMGEIWLAKLSASRGFEKIVVLKRLLPHLADDAEFLARFLDEARIAASLVHPNIVPVFEFGEDDEGCFLVMEHIEGIDLRTAMASVRGTGAGLDPLLALHIAREVALALDYAHNRVDEHGRAALIVHRDVSPSNILLGHDGGVRLTDFGIAAARVRLGKTATGHLRGKFAYMSPEQASGRSIDARSDVFALGIVLYEMLAGTRPFEGDAELAILERIRNGDRVPIDVARPGLDVRLCDLVEACLTVDVVDRLPSAADFAERADAILHAAGSPVGRRDVMRVVTETADRLPATSDGSGPVVGIDTLLRRQLEGHSDSQGARSGGRTPSRSGRIARTPALSAALHDATRTTAEPASAPRRKKRRTWATVLAAAVSVALLCVGGWFAFSIASVRVLVASEPAGARVFVDGAPVGVTALRTRLWRGVVLIRVERDGYEPVEREVDLRDGPASLSLELEAAPSLVTVDSVPPGAQVQIDGLEPFTAGTSVRLPTAQPLHISMSAPGYVAWSGVVTLVPGQTSFSQRLEPAAAAMPTTNGGVVAVLTADAGERPAPHENDDRPERAPPATAPTADADRVNTGVDAGSTANRGTLVVRFVNEPRVGTVEIDGTAVVVDGLATSYPLSAGPHRVVVRNEAHRKEFSAAVDVPVDGDTVLAVEW